MATNDEVKNALTDAQLTLLRAIKDAVGDPDPVQSMLRLAKVYALVTAPQTYGSFTEPGEPQ